MNYLSIIIIDPRKVVGFIDEYFDDLKKMCILIC